MKKFFFILFLRVFSLCFATDLSKENPAWVTVLGGSMISKPVRTSYGYAAVCDGKMLFGFTHEGKLLWQKNYRDRFSPFLTRGPGDTLITVIKDSSVQFLNPGGMVLWTSDAGFKIEGSALLGRDGRFFIRGKKNIACLTITSNVRWVLQTEVQDTRLDLCPLEDGSVLIFLEKKSEGKTVARRVSPFGVMSEEIIFSGAVTNAVCSSDGVLLSFSDGSVGMCSVNSNGETYSRWVLHSSETKSTSSPFICTEGFKKNAAAVISDSGTEILFINTLKGTVTSRFLLDKEHSISVHNIQKASNTIQGFFVCDLNKALCISGEKIVWDAVWSRGKKFDYIYATDSGYLVFCTSSWTVEAFRLKQNLSTSKTTFYDMVPAHYKSFYPPSYPSDNVSGVSISTDDEEKFHKIFTRGEGFQDEAKALSVLLSEAAQMSEDFSTVSWDRHAQTPFFAGNTPYCAKVLNLMAESGLTLWSNLFSQMMKKTSDETLLYELVRCAEKASFDGDGLMLSTIDNLTRTVISRSNDTLLKAVCDAVFSICRFMGKPALIEKGRSLLSLLLTAKYSSAVNEYSRKTLDKILELDL